MNTVEAKALGIRPGFTQIPNAIYNLPLSKNAIAVLNVLLIFKWDNEPGCYPSQTTIMKLSRLSKNSVIDACRELSDYRIIECQRRGDGQPNYYRFLDASLDEMIKRVLKMPRIQRPRKQAAQANKPRRQADEQPLDFSAMLQAEITPSDYFSDLSNAEPLLDWFASMDTTQHAPTRTSESDCAHERASEQAAPDLADLIEPQIDKTDQQIDTPPPADFTSTDFEPVRSSDFELPPSSKIDPNNTIDPNKTQFKKHTQTRAHALTRVPHPKSKYSLAECIAYAWGRIGTGIKNPVGYGTAIWHDGRDDERIAELHEAKQHEQQHEQQPGAEPTNRSDVFVKDGSYDPDCPICMFGWRYANGFGSELVRCQCAIGEDSAEPRGPALPVC